MSIYREEDDLTGYLFKDGKVTDEKITLTYEDFDCNNFIWEFIDIDKEHHANVEVILINDNDQDFKPKYAVVLVIEAMYEHFEYYYMNTLLDVNDFLGRIEPFINVCKKVEKSRLAFHEQIEKDYYEDYLKNKEEYLEFKRQRARKKYLETGGLLDH